MTVNCHFFCAQGFWNRKRAKLIWLHKQRPFPKEVLWQAHILLSARVTSLRGTVIFALNKICLCFFCPTPIGVLSECFVQGRRSRPPLWVQDPPPGTQNFFFLGVLCQKLLFFSTLFVNWYAWPLKATERDWVRAFGSGEGWGEDVG